MIEPRLIYNGDHNPFYFFAYPLAIISHSPRELGTNASSVIFKVIGGLLRKGFGR
jgi:hypothetical protein